MFDIGFMELLLIGVILLLVVGPERLPKLARFAGVWYGKAMRSFESVKQEVNREIAAEELKKTLAKQTASADVFDIVEETKKDIQELGKDADDALKAPKQTLADSDEDKNKNHKPADDRS